MSESFNGMSFSLFLCCVLYLSQFAKMFVNEGVADEFMILESAFFFRFGEVGIAGKYLFIG